MSLPHILDTIERDLRDLALDRPRIVGVNGVDLAGKTLFCPSLIRHLNDHGHRTALIHLDDFHNPRETRYQGADPVQSYWNHAFSLELLESELLAPAARGEVIDKSLILLDLDTDSFSQIRHYAIDRHTVVILEGVLLYREPIDRYFDYRIFLDIPFEEVLRRAELRDVARYGPEFVERYREKYIPIQQRYLAECTPGERSNLVIDNRDVNHPSIVAHRPGPGTG
jgi:phosphoglycolate phosphatase